MINFTLQDFTSSMACTLVESSTVKGKLNITVFEANLGRFLFDYAKEATEEVIATGKQVHAAMESAFGSRLRKGAFYRTNSQVSMGLRMAIEEGGGRDPGRHVASKGRSHKRQGRAKGLRKAV